MLSQTADEKHKIHSLSLITLSFTFIHFHPFYPLSSTFIHLYPLSKWSEGKAHKSSDPPTEKLRDAILPAFKPLRENYQKIARFCCWNTVQQFCCWNTFKQQHCWNIFEECCCWKLVFHKCPRLHCCPGNFISRANWKPSDKLFIKLSSNFPLSKVTLVNALVGGALAKRRVALRSTCCKLEQTKFVASTRETPNLVFSVYFGTTWMILENAMGVCSNSDLHLSMHDQGWIVSE